MRASEHQLPTLRSYRLIAASVWLTGSATPLIMPLADAILATKLSNQSFSLLAVTSKFHLIFVLRSYLRVATNEVFKQEHSVEKVHRNTNIITQHVREILRRLYVCRNHRLSQIFRPLVTSICSSDAARNSSIDIPSSSLNFNFGPILVPT